MERFESIYIFDFDCELLGLLWGVDLEQRIGMNRGMPIETGLPFDHTCGEARLRADGSEDAFESRSFGTFFRHRKSRGLFIVYQCSRFVNICIYRTNKIKSFKLAR